ncbi:tryptophanyl-tRNA synthetase [Rhodococcus sp. 27YEA15]
MNSYTTSRARSDDLNTDVARDPARYRILTGERPTGPLHLGHYFGTVTERVRLQNLGIETFVILADYQVITDRDGIGRVRENVYAAVLDYLAAGIDPEQSTVFTHSAVPALNQLLLPFLSLVTEAELHRNPTVKAELGASGRALSGLLLTYPVHQAADILFCKGNLVPVGKDNLPHVELTRLIARRFNERYGPIFPEPQALLTPSPEVPGLDGRKMSKSYGNAISLSMTADQTADLIRRAPTDSNRTITFDPEIRPGVSALLTTAALCCGADENAIAAEIGDGGSAMLKKLTTEAVNDYLAGHRHRREEFAADPVLVRDVLRAGNEHANEIALRTLDEVGRPWAPCTRASTGGVRRIDHCSCSIRRALPAIRHRPHGRRSTSDRDRPVDSERRRSQSTDRPSGGSSACLLERVPTPHEISNTARILHCRGPTLRSTMPVHHPRSELPMPHADPQRRPGQHPRVLDKSFENARPGSTFEEYFDPRPAADSGREVELTSHR